MTLTTVTYIGFVVASLIIMWAIVETSRRFLMPRKPRHKDEWVAFKPHTIENVETLPPSHEDEEEHDHHSAPQSRAQKNGHYSGSKQMHT